VDRKETRFKLFATKIDKNVNLIRKAFNAVFGASFTASSIRLKMQFTNCDFLHRQFRNKCIRLLFWQFFECDETTRSKQWHAKTFCMTAKEIRTLE